MTIARSEEINNDDMSILNLLNKLLVSHPLLSSVSL